MTIKKIYLLCTFILALSACSNDGDSTPENVSKQYWQAILSGDTEAANELVLETTNTELSQIIQPGRESSVSFGSSNVDDKRARTETHLTWSDDNQMVEFNFETHLIRADGAWRVNAELTQESFFQSVYEFSLTDEGINFLPAPTYNEDQLSTAELDAMLKELEDTSLELQRQKDQGSRDTKALMELLDPDLQKKIEEM